MSSPLAIAAVTAVLKDLLNNGLIDHDLATTLGNVGMTAKSPGAIKADANEQAQLNLFMYMVTPNAAWRNADLPAYDSRGDRVTNQALALDLHYLLTAYGQNDFQAEILLGYAMHLLHERPILTRAAIGGSLAASPPIAPSGLPPRMQKLSSADLAEQVESIKIIPEFLNIEELSKLWSTFHTHYRPTVAYRVSVVLIEAQHLTRTPLPVLTLGAQTQPSISQPLFATLTAIELPNRQSSARLGDLLVIHGYQLDSDDVEVQFKHPQLSDLIKRKPTSTAANQIQVTIPDEPTIWAAGIYTVTVVVRRKDRPEQVTNSLPLALAPRITPTVSSSSSGKSSSLTIACSPTLQEGQRVSLLLGTRELPISRNEEQGSKLTAVLTDIPPGEYTVRLRVDGVDSLLIDWAGGTPAFDRAQKVTIA